MRDLPVPFGAGSALILSLRNSGENPSLLRRSGYEGRKYEAIQRGKNKNWAVSFILTALEYQNGTFVDLSFTDFDTGILFQ